MKIALFGKRRQTPEDVTKILALITRMSEKGIMVGVEERFYDALLRASGLSQIEVDDVFNGREFTADYAFSIGGDGTFLATARSVAEKEIPIAGFNTGTLGFLAEEGMDDAWPMVERIEKKEYEIEERGLIEVRSPGLELYFADWPVALNEVAVLRHDSDAMITVDAYLNSMELASVRGDGLLVATPTGSTAYNLSVGGPIMAPGSPCRILSPIAPHSLTLRPMVVGDDCEIELRVKVRGSSYRLAIDGRGITVPADTKLLLRKPDFVTRIIRAPGHDFVKTLHDKLLWGAK